MTHDAILMVTRDRYETPEFESFRKGKDTVWGQALMANGSNYRHGGGRGGGSGRSRSGNKGRSGGRGGGGNNDGSRNEGGGGSAVGREATGARGEPRDICGSRGYFWSKCPELLCKHY